LRSEIDQRRGDLSRDLEMIGNRVSPRRIVERRTQAIRLSTRARARGMKESIMGTADDMSTITRQRAIDLREQTSGTAGGLIGSAQDATHAMTESASQVPDRVKGQTQGNPIAAGLVAFGMGLLAATVIPASRGEKRLAQRVQPKLEDAARSAAEAGRGLAEDMKPVVQESASHLQESAQDSMQHVKQQAADAAQSVKGEAQTAATHVKDAARS